MRLSNLIEYKQDVETNDEIRIKLLKDNLRRAKLTSKIIILLEMIVLLVSFINSVLKGGDQSQLSGYFIMYTLMIIVNFVLLIFINKFGHLENKPMAYLNNWEKAIVSYVTFLMCWGSVVSLMDQKLYGQVTVFMVNLVVFSVLYYIESKKLIIPYAMSSAILFIFLPLVQASRDVLLGHYVNLVIFIGTSWFCSRVLYKHYCKEFFNKMLLEEANAKLKEMSLVDELTNIPNRRSFNDFISLAYDCNSNVNVELSTFMIDIDFFKQYNDNYGHVAGDEVLKLVGNIINSVAIDNMNFAARVGGEEFVYVAVETNEEESYKLAEKIKMNVKNLKIPHEYSETSKYVSVSIGISTMKVSTRCDILKCLEFADSALYEAKNGGRDCIKIANNSVKVEEYVM